MHRRDSLLRFLPPVALVLACFSLSARAAETTTAKPTSPVKPLTWYPSYKQACTEAKKADRLILAYFCGSDWDEWTKKLDKEVFGSQMFHDWAEKNAVLLKIDFLKFRPNTLQKEQNEYLKNKYVVTKVPTLLFLDPDGLLIARCGYDTASLKEDEDKGKPVAWIKHCEEVIKNRPPAENVIEQKTLDDSIKYARKHYLPLVLMITKADAPPLVQKQKAELLKNQPFVKFINQNFAFVQLTWPVETDQSDAAKELRTFIEENKIPPATFQLAVWDFYAIAPKAKLRDRILGNPDTDALIDRLDKSVENPDYDGKWLDDYRQAKFISSRLRRPLFMYFTQTDGNEYAQKFESEIFQTPTFKEYARKNLILLRLDYPKTAEKQKAQPDALKEQNKQLADQYAIRGYPMVIVVNFMGQRIGDSKYMAGGAEFFVKQLDQIVRNDRFSRP
jgi:thioredoxin-related protein